MEDGAVQCCW